MTNVELAERHSRARAFVLLLFAVIIVLALAASFGEREPGLVGGFWTGVTATAATGLLPIARWLRPNSPIARLLDDEGTRQHRAWSALTGFWAAVMTGVALSVATAEGWQVEPFDVARLIATAAVGVAFVSFALLELRATRD